MTQNSYIGVLMVTPTLEFYYVRAFLAGESIFGRSKVLKALVGRQGNNHYGLFSCVQHKPAQCNNCSSVIC
jgi:hypothetical protein